MLHLLKHRLLVASVASLALLASCKKSDSASAPSTGTGSTTDAIKDSALADTKDIYLWYNQIPATFNAKSYADLDAFMTAIRQYSTEPGFSSPVDRWSFAIKQSEWNNVSSGIAGDFGLNVFFRVEGDLRVKSVESASPAGLAGIRRGWRITKINGNTNMTTANADYIVQAVWNSSSSTITFQKPDGSTVDINLTAATYQAHPVILDSVYTAGSKKVAYLSFNSFLGDTAEIYNAFSRVFNKFSTAGVNDVIVDMRYNGGGYVSVSQKLADWLAPSSANGQLMMKEQFNDKYTSENTTDYFSKLGSLNLNRVFFIVSSNTASASELLINNLKPFMDVQLIGPSKTYGKPVGFFPIPEGDSYIFPVSFRSTNKNGEGNYFNGLALNSQVADGLDKDWGDVSESCLQSALQYVSTGAYRVAAGDATVIRAQQEISSGNNVLTGNSFKGAVSSHRLDK
jgi:C-terminal processing protease CtpA/Prc